MFVSIQGPSTAVPFQSPISGRVMKVNTIREKEGQWPRVEVGTGGFRVDGWGKK